MLKNLIQTEEYKEIDKFLSGKIDHSKLKKLYEILSYFFTEGKTRENSKVIIFTQYRESAKEIKNYIDDCQKANLQQGLIRAELFLG